MLTKIDKKQREIVEKKNIVDTLIVCWKDMTDGVKQMEKGVRTILLIVFYVYINIYIINFQVSDVELVINSKKLYGKHLCFISKLNNY